MDDRTDNKFLFKLLTGVLAVIALVLLMASVAVPKAMAEETWTISGQVIGVDPYAGTLTIKLNGRSDSLIFHTDQMTSIRSCEQSRTIRDIGVRDIEMGKDVAVTYHEKEGKLLADLVENESTIALACANP